MCADQVGRRYHGNGNLSGREGGGLSAAAAPTKLLRSGGGESAGTAKNWWKYFWLCFIFSNLEVSYSSVHKHAYATSCMRCCLGGVGIFRSSQIASDAIWDKI